MGVLASLASGHLEVRATGQFRREADWRDWGEDQLSKGTLHFQRNQ